MHLLDLFWTSLLLTLAGISLAVPTAAGKVTVRDVWQFSDPTWVENVAVRSNGHLLVTVASRPDLYQIDPTGGAPLLVHTFPQYISLLGIAEIESDVFAVVTGNVTLATLTSIQGTFSSCFVCDLTHCKHRVRIVFHLES